MKTDLVFDPKTVVPSLGDFTLGQLRAMPAWGPTLPGARRGEVLVVLADLSAGVGEPVWTDLVSVHKEWQARTGRFLPRAMVDRDLVLLGQQQLATFHDPGLAHDAMQWRATADGRNLAAAVLVYVAQVDADRSAQRQADRIGTRS